LPGSRRSRGRRLAIALLFSAALLVVAELCARIATVPDPRFPRGRDVFIAVGGLTLDEVDQIIDGDGELFWRLKPNLHGRPWLKPLWLDTRTSSLALRSPEVSIPKPQDHFRVLSLGDSCTYGSGVVMGDTYPSQLEQMLNMVYEADVYEVVNGGCPGYSSFQGVQLFKERGTKLQPDIVTISFGINDASPWSGMSDADTYRRINPPVLKALLESALVRLVATPVMRLMHAGPSIVRADASPPGPGDAAPAPRATPAQFHAQLTELVGLVRAAGAKPVLIVHPHQAQVKGEWPETQYQAEVRRVASETQTPLCDFVAALSGKPQVFIDNCHLKREGCQLVAAALFKTLKEQGLIPEPPTLAERREARSKHGG
jgi:lysophospholipase L1-like esterase